MAEPNDPIARFGALFDLAKRKETADATAMTLRDGGRRRRA